jgi:hypothetical protein
MEVSLVFSTLTVRQLQLLELLVTAKSSARSIVIRWWPMSSFIATEQTQPLTELASYSSTG